MGGTYQMTVGDRGRIVPPAELRERSGLRAGTPIVVVESESGIVLMTREQLRARIQQDLAGVDLVKELLADRRAAAAVEDAS